MAKGGNAGGNGGGSAGGNAGGNGGGSAAGGNGHGAGGVGASHAASAAAFGQSTAEQARGHAGRSGTGISNDARRAAASARSIGLDTAALGRMNAAHASPRARERAAPNSVVGQIASYESALLGGDLKTAAQALANLSKPGVPENPVRGLNDRLRLEVDDQTLTAVIDQARQIQTERQ